MLHVRTQDSYSGERHLGLRLHKPNLTTLSKTYKPRDASRIRQSKFGRAHSTQPTALPPEHQRVF